MSQYQILQKVIMKNIPEIQKIPKHRRKTFLKKFFSVIIDDLVQKIKLPDIWEIKSRIIKERYLDMRRPKGHERGEWKLDYNLWRMLYEAKLQMNYAINNDNMQEVRNYTNYTDYSSYEKGFSENSDDQSYLSLSTNSTTILKHTQNLKLDEKLEEKVLHNEHYKILVRNIDSAIRTSKISEFGNADFYLYEQKDIENQNWEKLILDVNLHNESIESKISKWEIIRNIIDQYNQTSKEIFDKKSFEDLKQRFYINMIF